VTKFDGETYLEKQDHNQNQRDPRRLISAWLFLAPLLKIPKNGEAPILRCSEARP
jgi:hypothetical protein